MMRLWTHTGKCVDYGAGAYDERGRDEQVVGELAEMFLREVAGQCEDRGPDQGRLKPVGLLVIRDHSEIDRPQARREPLLVNGSRLLVLQDPLLTQAAVTLGDVLRGGLLGDS